MIAVDIDVQNNFAANDNITSVSSILNELSHKAVSFLTKLRPNRPWVLTAIVPDGRTVTETMHSADDVIRFVRAYNGTHNVYYSVNPTRAELWNKATKEDIACIEFALADLDPREDETSDEAKDRYLTALEHNQPHPSAIIDSGNGLQVLWRLDQPIALGELVDRKYSPEDQARIDDVEARIGALIVRLGGETGTQNIDRILRLPGTIKLPNRKKRKTGRGPCGTRLMVFEDTTHPLTDDYNCSYFSDRRR